MFKVLVIGRNGQLGWELMRLGAAKGFDINAVDLPEFDITNKDTIESYIQEKPTEVVINASAYTAVDKAESEPGIAFAVNRDGPKLLASICQSYSIPLVHISTDYVFDGEKETAYIEDDPVAPAGVYGLSKAEGEIAVRETLNQHFILRTAWLYGVHGNNFVKTMLKLGRDKATLNVVNDQHGCPTYTVGLVEAILCIVKRIQKIQNVPWGTYHYCGKGQTTWYGFAKKIFELAAPHIDLKIRSVNPIPSTNYPTPAARPVNSVLNCTKIEKAFNLTRSPWECSLLDMLKQYLGVEIQL